MDVGGFIALLLVLVFGVILVWVGHDFNVGGLKVIGGIIVGGSIIGFLWYFHTSE